MYGSIYPTIHQQKQLNYRKDHTVLMALLLLNYMKFISGLNISPLNRTLCVLLFLFFAADDKRFTALDGLRLHINTVHLPKRLSCVEYEYATNSATHLQRHAKRQHDIANFHVKRWKHEQKRDQEPHNVNSELVTKFYRYSSFWAQLFYKIYGSFPEVSSCLHLHFGNYQLESDVCQCTIIWNLISLFNPLKCKELSVDFLRYNSCSCQPIANCVISI